MRHLRGYRGAVNILLVLVVILAIVILGGVAYWIQSRGPGGGSGLLSPGTSRKDVGVDRLVEKVLSLLPDGDGYIIGYSSEAGQLAQRWQKSAVVPQEWKDVVDALKKLHDKFAGISSFGLSVQFGKLKNWIDTHKDEDSLSEDVLEDFDGLYFAIVAVMKDEANLEDVIDVFNGEILPAIGKAASNQPDSSLRNLSLQIVKKSGDQYIMHVQFETEDGDTTELDLPVYYQQDGDLFVITFPKPLKAMPGGLAQDSIFKEQWDSVKGKDFGVLAVLKEIPDMDEFEGPVVARITGEVSEKGVDTEIHINKGLALKGKAIEAFQKIPVGGRVDIVVAVDLGLLKQLWIRAEQKFANEVEDESELGEKITSFLSDKVLGIYFAYGEKPRLYLGITHLTVAQLKEFVSQISQQGEELLNLLLANPKDVGEAKVYDLTPLITSQGIPVVSGEKIALIEYEGNLYFGLGVIDEDIGGLTGGVPPVYQKIKDFVANASPEIVWYSLVSSDFKEQLEKTVEAISGAMPQQLQKQLEEMVVVPYEEFGMVDFKADDATYIHVIQEFTVGH